MPLGISDTDERTLGTNFGLGRIRQGPFVMNLRWISRGVHGEVQGFTFYHGVGFQVLGEKTRFNCNKRKCIENVTPRKFFPRFFSSPQRFIKKSLWKSTSRKKLFLKLVCAHFFMLSLMCLFFHFIIWREKQDWNIQSII